MVLPLRLWNPRSLQSARAYLRRRNSVSVIDQVQAESWRIGGLEQGIGPRTILISALKTLMSTYNLFCTIDFSGARSIRTRGDQVPIDWSESAQPDVQIKPLSRRCCWRDKSVRRCSCPLREYIRGCASTERLTRWLFHEEDSVRKSRLLKSTY